LLRGQRNWSRRERDGLGIDVDRAGHQIDSLIERRVAEREQANYEVRAWAEGEKRYNVARAHELRLEWCEDNRHRTALFEDLAAHNREELGTLVDLRGEGPTQR
jgi:hypothetical protein